MRLRARLPTSAPWSASPGFWIVSVLVLIVAAALRWHTLSSTSLWLDELGQVYVARLPLPESLAAIRYHAAAAPLDYIATSLVFQLAEPILGLSTTAARLWPFACGLASVAAVGAATLELTRSRPAALLAATIAAFSGILVFYSQEARFYSLAVLLTVLATWSFARAIRRGRRRDWAIYGATAIAGVCTYYLMAYLLLLQGASMLAVSIGGAWRVRPLTAAMLRVAREMMPMVVVGSVTVATFLPWYLFAARFQFAVDHGYPALPALDLTAIARLLASLLAAYPRGGLPDGIPIEARALVVVVVILAAIGIAALYRQQAQSALAIALFMVTLIPLVWELDSRSHYFVSPRQFILIVPFAAICAGAGGDALLARLAKVVDRARPRSGGPVRTVGSVIVVITLVTLSLPPLARVYDGSFQIREDWQSASAFTSRVLCPGGKVHSNLREDYYYGVGFYAPETMDSALKVPGDVFLGDALKEDPPSTTDVVVAFVPIVWTPGRGTIDTVAQILGARGFRYRDFTQGRIRVFYVPEAC